MKEKAMLKLIKSFSFFIFIFIILFNLNIVKSQIDDEEEEEKKDYYIHFDLSDPDIILIEKDNPNPELNDIVSKTHSVRLPTVELDKEGYFFSGWTEDGIIGYEPGDVFLCNSKNITLKPVMGELSDGRFFSLEYIVEFEGEIIDPKGTLPKGRYVKNRIIQISMMVFPQDTAIQKGWTDGNRTFFIQDKMIMPEHNVTLHARFLYYHYLTYDSGDVDGIVGVKQNIQRGHYGAQMDLAEITRLKRIGYENSGWHCENDGMDYPGFFLYIMPDEDVIMTAIWKPVRYTIVFRTQVKTIPDIRIRAETGNIIIAPSLDVEREGYNFVGWQVYTTEFYYPGDEILIKGQLPGSGISASAIWELK